MHFVKREDSAAVCEVSLFYHAVVESFTLKCATRYTLVAVFYSFVGYEFPSVCPRVIILECVCMSSVMLLT